MIILKTYVDANILISIHRHSNSDQAGKIISFLDNPARKIIVSDFLVLETIPKPAFHKRSEEILFMKGFIARAYRHVRGSPKIAEEAIALASRYDLQALDALHVSAALSAKADEFLTLEKPSSPLCRVKEMQVISMHEPI